MNCLCDVLPTQTMSTTSITDTFYSPFCLQHLAQYPTQNEWLQNIYLLSYRQKINSWFTLNMQRRKKETHFLYHVNLHQKLMNRFMNQGVKHTYLYLGI